MLHLAASIDIAESFANPLKYYRNNSFASATLIRACITGGVERFLFASSAAVYGMWGTASLGEDAPAAPVHAYGRSKLGTERLLRETAQRLGLRYAALRYFNVAGAGPLGRAGPSGAMHLITAACQAALGLRDGVTVFGADYPTPDGTCVRDYIHVSDLASIHVAALRGLDNRAPGRVLNCGSGRGASVREVPAAVRAEAGDGFEIRAAPATPRSWAPIPRSCAPPCTGHRATVTSTRWCAAHSPGKEPAPAGSAQAARTCIYGHLEERNAQRLSTSSLRRRLRLTLDDRVRPPHHPADNPVVSV